MSDQWRTGSAPNGGRIYEVDTLIGHMATPDLATLVVEAVNEHLARLSSWPPANVLIDLTPGREVWHPCGCNQLLATHEQGDAGWCRATIAAGVGYG